MKDGLPFHLSNKPYNPNLTPMKNRIFPFIAISLLMVASSCSSETSQSDEPDEPVVENSNTLTIRLSQSDFTRADGEDKVNSLNVVFLKDNTFKETKAAKPTSDPNVFKVEVPGTLTDHPNGIIAYANCTTNDQSLDALRKRSLSSFGNSTDGFAMSSISSFDESGNEKLIIPVSFEHFTESGKTLDLNLERLCAKVTLNKDDAFTDNSEATDNNVKLGVYLSLEGWLLSCIDTETFLFKNYNGTLPEGSWWRASDNGNKSTHWAFSTKYSIAKYPKNNSEAIAIIEKENVKYANITEGPKSFSSTVYCHETTRPASTYDDPNTQPSIVLVGTYRTTTDQNSDAVDLYRLSDGTFKTVEDYWKLIASEPAMLKKSSGQTTVNDLKSILTIDKHVADNPDRIVEIKLKDGITAEELAPYNKNLEDIEAINTYLKEKFGFAEKYHQGKCYFVVPIQHKNYKTDPTLESQPEGAFGIVRNHHYTISLKGLKGVGYGVADGNSYLLQADYDPSTPQYSIDINTSVVNWSEVTGQTIE